MPRIHSLPIAMSIPAAKKKILFFAEPATLAHVARPTVLAGTLDPELYDVSVATGNDYKSIVTDAGLVTHGLWSIGSKAYLKAVDTGKVVFSYSMLKRYVQDDLRLIRAIKPDVVVGDFRLSLTISARLLKVPYIGISNAYWSPYAHADYEIPVHPATQLFGFATANYIFRLFRPFILAYHSLPMYGLCKKYGMPSLGSNLKRVFTEADITVFADVPEMVPVKDCGNPDRYAYIGPVIWSPEAKIPAELAAMPGNLPLVYIAMGSSGDPKLLNTLVKAAASLNCRIAVATSGGALDQSIFGHIVARNFLPGSKIAAMAKLVICNGGSPGTHQALLQGIPVLGIPANMDQLLNMDFVVKTGSGLKIRADQITSDFARAAIARILDEPEFSVNAQKVAGWFRNYLPEKKFPATLNKIIHLSSQAVYPA